MAGAISKNARREGAKVLVSRWGGEIKTKSIFENGKLHHIAYCVKSGNTARKPPEDDGAPRSGAYRVSKRYV